MRDENENIGGYLLTETSLTEEARQALVMDNHATQKYNKHVIYFNDYLVNEGRQGLEDDVTMCNYMAFLKKNRYSSGSIWQVYTVLDRESMI